MLFLDPLLTALIISMISASHNVLNVVKAEEENASGQMVKMCLFYPVSRNNIHTYFYHCCIKYFYSPVWIISLINQIQYTIFLHNQTTH